MAIPPDESPASKNDDQLDQFEAAMQRSASTKRLVLGIGAAVGLIGIVVITFIVARSGQSKPVPEAVKVVEEPPAFDYGEYDWRIRDLREKIQHDTCDKKNARQLTKYLNRAGDYRSVTQFVSHFEEKCGDWPRLLWSAEYAHRQLSQFAEAAAVSDRLVHDRPSDADFWWWRARNEASAGNTLQARADYRQSMGNGINKYAASYFSKLVTSDAPCEGAFALRLFAQQRPERAGSWVKKDQTQLYMKGDCSKLSGSGRAKVKRTKGSPLVQTQAKVGGTQGTFVLDDKTAYATVTRDFAQRAGITTGNESIELYVGAEFVEATMATSDIAVGNAVAERVHIAITDKLPGDIDGILGQSYLWRFVVENDDKTVRLSAW